MKDIYFTEQFQWTLPSWFDFTFLAGLENMTEKESAHPTSQQLHDLTTTANGELVGPLSPQVPSSPTSSPQDCPQLPVGTSIQPPAHPNTLPPIQDLKLSDKVRRHVGWSVGTPLR